MKDFVSLVCLFFLVACAGTPARFPVPPLPPESDGLKAFQNPVIPGFHPDPSICRVGDDYYLVNSTFEYFPGVPVYHSKDLLNWRSIGHCLTRKSQLDVSDAGPSRGIFAPTIRHHDGVFYMVTTDVNKGNFYVTATDPAGPWSEPIFVDQPGIDPSLFFDDDGKVYFKSNSKKGKKKTELGMYMAEIDIRTGRLLTESRFLWRGIGGRYPEAPHLYKVDGWYYLVLAEGGTEYGHMVTVARSRSPWGPFESCPYNPILSNEDVMYTEFQATGHADLVQDHRGNWWVVFLAVRAVGYPRLHHLGRETCLAPVTWSKDGWPIVNRTRTAALQMTGPLLPPHPWPKSPVRDDFDTPDLALHWNFVRNPIAANWSLSKSKGKLWLRCSDRVLGEQKTPLPTIVGRRQQHFWCRATTRLQFEPKANHEEAGLRVLMNDTYHYEVAVTQRGGQRGVLLRRTVGTLSHEESFRTLPPGPVELSVRAEKRWYHFRYKAADGSTGELGKGETRLLSTQIAGGFTGVYFGMYAGANGKPSDNAAAFDWFDYQPESEPKKD